MINDPKQFALALYQAQTSIKNESDFVKLADNFIEILKKSNRLSLWPKIFRKFEHLLIKKNRLQKVRITTSQSLTDNQKQEIGETFNAGAKIDYLTDKKIIGGIKITINDEKELDASIENRINSLFK